MTDTIMFAYHHYFFDGGGWLAHMIFSAAIHAVIYSFIFRLIHHLTTGELAALVVVGLVGLFMWNRTRDRRLW
jgi:hypothetical protein